MFTEREGTYFSPHDENSLHSQGTLNMGAQCYQSITKSLNYQMFSPFHWNLDVDLKKIY